MNKFIWEASKDRGDTIGGSGANPQAHDEGGGPTFLRQRKGGGQKLLEVSKREGRTFLRFVVKIFQREGGDFPACH